MNDQTVKEYERLIENAVREPTDKNKKSSRSHVIVILEETIKEKVIRLIISDLAGSVNSKKSNTTGVKIFNLKEEKKDELTFFACSSSDFYSNKNKKLYFFIFLYITI